MYTFVLQIATSWCNLTTQQLHNSTNHAKHASITVDSKSPQLSLSQSKSAVCVVAIKCATRVRNPHRTPTAATWRVGCNYAYALWLWFYKYHLTDCACQPASQQVALSLPAPTEGCVRLFLFFLVSFISSLHGARCLICARKSYQIFPTFGAVY